VSLNMNKTVLVTGASSGIGRAAAVAFAQRGDNVVLGGRDAPKLDAALREIDRPEQTSAVVGDIGDVGTAQRLVAAAVDRFGGVDVLVNSAGAFAVKSFVDFSADDIDQLLATNLKGTFLVTQAAVRAMKRQGRGGAIVNVTASIAIRGWTAIPATAASATKGALNTITNNLALELAADNIRVNAVAPGLIKTPLHGRTEEQFAELNGLQPLHRVGTTKDIVDAILYLADADFTTGTVLPVDGGVTAGHW
jgi:NAD(P)-dependent dehydrogenase (short-subunit alcohol dehydrogenase family)